MRVRVLAPFIALALTAACTTTGPQQAPGVPHGLTAVSGLDSRVDLTWREPTSGEPEQYRIYRADASGDFERLVECDGGETGYTDASAVNGTYYEYRVTALTGDGESDPSGIAWATPYYDFEEAWGPDPSYWLPEEGDGVVYCIYSDPDDTPHLCRIDTDGVRELASVDMCWGYPAAGQENIFTLATGKNSLIRVWTYDLTHIDNHLLIDRNYKELASLGDELFTINVDTGVVDVLDTQGSYQRSISEPGHDGPGMTDPFGLDVSPGGTLYVVDMAEESLLAFDAVSGALVWRISAPDLPTDFRFPSDAAVAPDGFVYLVSGVNQEFMVIDSAGRQIKRVPFDWAEDAVYHLAVADDFTVCLSRGEELGNGMMAYRPVGLSGNEAPPVVAMRGGGVR